MTGQILAPMCWLLCRQVLLKGFKVEIEERYARLFSSQQNEWKGSTGGGGWTSLLDIPHHEYDIADMGTRGLGDPPPLK